MDGAPVTVLLSKLWTALTIEADNAFEVVLAHATAGRARRPRPTSLAMWANGLRLIDEAGTPVAEVGRRAGAGCNLGGLERWGWISVGGAAGPPQGRRDGYGRTSNLRPVDVLRPTAAGSAARRSWPIVLDDAEARWHDRFGADILDGLRRAATPLAAGMPWAPPQVAASDGFRTHVTPPDPPDPSDTSEVPARPLLVVLGQALAGLTVRTEAASPVSLPLAEDLLHHLDGGPVAARDLPRRTGVSKEAVAMAVNFAVRRRLGMLRPGRVAALSARGRADLAGCRDAVAATDASAAAVGLRAPLEAILGQPGLLAAGLEPPEGCWRGDKPYLAQTRRILDDPLAALPRQPMVLHRGGWPDGA